MKVPFVSFLPMERELDADLRAAFSRVFERSWYIDGKEDEAFEKAFANILCRFTGKGRQGDWSDGSVHIQLEHAAIHTQNHNERQNPYEQSADKGNCP